MQDDERCCGTGTCLIDATPPAAAGAASNGTAKQCAALQKRPGLLKLRSRQHPPPTVVGPMQ